MTRRLAASTAASSAASSAAQCVVLAAASLLLLAGVAALGDSAAVPGLGPATAHPPWDLHLHPPSWLVSVLQAAGFALGGLGVWRGLDAVRDGWRPRAGRVLLIGVLAALALTLVPPSGSADHLSYVAYGRIAAAGDDPYRVPPIQWHGGGDPVASAVQPPWRNTPSIYGPVAGGAFALVAWLGGGSLRLTVWWWQLVCALAFIAVALALDRATRADPARRARAAIVWTLNPLLLGQLVLGAHVDGLAAAFAVGALLLMSRTPLLAGAMLGAAVGTKATYTLVGLAALWGLWGLPPRRRLQVVLLGVLGAAIVLVPAHLVAGPHVFDQLRAASGFTSIASPWRAVVNLVELATGPGSLRGVVVPVSLVVAAGLAVLLGRALPCDDDEHRPDDATRRAVLAALVLTAAWVLTAPYALPWYDAMVWAPLALAAATPAGALLDRALLVRLTVLSIAYVPGRVVELSPMVETITLAGRRYLAPVVAVGVLVLVVRRSLDARRALTPR